MTHESEKPRESLFSQMVRHSTGDNDPWVHRILVNGVPVVRFNYSKDPFANTGTLLPIEVMESRRNPGLSAEAMASLEKRLADYEAVPRDWNTELTKEHAA